MSELRTFSVSELGNYLRSRESQLGELWVMKQHLINVGEVEDERMHRMYAKYGRVDVNSVTDEDAARLTGYLSSGDKPAVLIDENENDQQEPHRQYPPGCIEELCMLRGEPLPFHIKDRTHDQYIDAHKANNGGSSCGSTGRFVCLDCPPQSIPWTMPAFIYRTRQTNRNIMTGPFLIGIQTCH